MHPAGRYRLTLVLVAIVACAPLVAYETVATLASRPTGGDDPPRDTDGVAMQAGDAATRADDVISRVTALVDSAPAELAQSSNLARPLGYGDSTTNRLAGAVSVAVLDTGGANVAMLMGSAARMDAIPVAQRRALVRAAKERSVGGGLEPRDTSAIAIAHPHGGTDSIAFHVVKPLVTEAARCDCLLDTQGAIVAAITDRALRLHLGADSLPDDAPGIGRVASVRTTGTRRRDEVLLGLLGLLLAGVGTTVARRVHRGAQQVPHLRAARQLEVLDVNEMVLTAIDASSGRDGRVETRFDVSPALVLADRTQLLASIAALIVAARGSLPDGGTLRLTTSFVEVGAEAHARDGTPLGHHIVLTVEIGSSATRSAESHATPASEQRRASPAHSRLDTVAATAQAHGWHLAVADNGADARRVSLFMPLADATVSPVLDLLGLDEATRSA